MRVQYTFLAAEVSWTRDNRFNVYRGGLETLHIPSVPGSAERFFFVCCIEMAGSERGFPHQMRIELLDPDGQAILKGYERSLGTLPAPGAPARSELFPFSMPF